MRNKDKGKKKIEDKKLLSGRYEIIELIGTGSMSYVYKAKDTKKNSIVAIKILRSELNDDETFLKGFKNEAQAAINLRSENIIAGYSVVDEKDLHYIVMELAEGISLKKYIMQHEALSNEETIEIGKQIVNGIICAHKLGLIHRDIKPQNIIINDKGLVKITDFGIAKAVTSSTINAAVIGSVHYISPEQARGNSVDERSDIYSIGCVLYELITGRVPFTGESTVSVVMSHIKDSVTPPSKYNENIYPSLEKIILKCLAKIPNKRYSSATELFTDLDKAKKDTSGKYVDYYQEEQFDSTIVMTEADMQLITKLSNSNALPNLREGNGGDVQELLDRHGVSTNFFIRNYNIILAIIVLLLVVLLGFMGNYIYRNNLIGFGNTATNSQLLRSLDYDNIPVVGLPVENALSIAREYGIKLEIEEYEFSDDYDMGNITRVVGNGYKMGDVVKVALSKGPRVLDFSDLNWLNNTTLGQFIDMLDDRQLSYKIEEEYNGNVPMGHIVNVNKKLSTDMGDLVITVSIGSSNEYATIPSLVGRQLSVARSLVTSSGFIVGGVSYLKHPSVPLGEVISQSHEAGSSRYKGTAIDLVVSSGPRGEDFNVRGSTIWKGQINTYYVIEDTSSNPSNNVANTLYAYIRLKQIAQGKVKYYNLTKVRTYKRGTSIPVVFGAILGEEGISTGEVEVVDALNDVVLASYSVNFYQR